MTIAILRQALAQFDVDRIGTGEFVQICRSQTALLAALPERYRVVLEDVLMRLESASVFADESCSFSRADLTANLRIWLDKAQQQMERPRP